MKRRIVVGTAVAVIFVGAAAPLAVWLRQIARHAEGMNAPGNPATRNALI